jgi:hypothetical protein
MAGSNLGSLQNLVPTIVQQMDSIYRNYRNQEQEALATARLKATEWVDSISKSQEAQQPQASSATEVKAEPPKSTE